MSDDIEQGKPPKVRAYSAETRSEAECQDCIRLSPEATRERVRQHVKNTGHTARIIVERSTRYERDAS